MTTFDGRPTAISTVAAVSLSVVALALVAPWSGAALTVGAPATVALAAGTVTGRRGVVDLGAAGLIATLLLAAMGRPPAAALLVGGALSIAAWDVAGTAVELGTQLGRGADTRVLEVTRTAVSVGIGLAAAGVGYGIYRIASGGQPASAVALLLLAFVALTWALRVR